MVIRDPIIVGNEQWLSQESASSNLVGTFKDSALLLMELMPNLIWQRNGARTLSSKVGRNLMCSDSARVSHYVCLGNFKSWQSLGYETLLLPQRIIFRSPKRAG